LQQGFTAGPWHRHGLSPAGVKLAWLTQLATMAFHSGLASPRAGGAPQSEPTIRPGQHRGV